MITSIVLMKVEPKKINEVAQQLAGLERISEVYSVSGRYDIVAMIRTAENEELSQVVTEQFLQIDGIVSSETLIAFRVFSRYDLERMFDIS
ncbi:MAG: Lrp/AsnC ligand binding domain-containing protein [Desulfovibrionaceae bacterium]|jgi:DNA-binding Lrp family transcriptional regulator|nr:Lrp/AsnC ligand binding domain-containing protein [Desulfovibrionaceae bacterium]